MSKYKKGNYGNVTIIEKVAGLALWLAKNVILEI